MIIWLKKYLKKKIHLAFERYSFPTFKSSDDGFRMHHLKISFKPPFDPRPIVEIISEYDKQENNI